MPLQILQPQAKIYYNNIVEDILMALKVKDYMNYIWFAIILIVVAFLFQRYNAKQAAHDNDNEGYTVLSQ